MSKRIKKRIRMAVKIKRASLHRIAELHPFSPFQGGRLGALEYAIELLDNGKTLGQINYLVETKAKELEL